jgi:hypothetical protein
MNDNSLASVYAIFLSSLNNYLRQGWLWPSPEHGFASYVFHCSNENEPLPPAITLVWPREDRLIHSPLLASAGFWLGSGSGDTMRDTWLDGIARLTKRDAFPSDHQSFTYRPIELFGIAVGLAACGKQRPELITWFVEILKRKRKDLVGDVWATMLQTASELVTGLRKELPPLPDSELRLEDVALYRWMSKYLVSSKNENFRTIDELLLRKAVIETFDAPDFARAAVLYQSLRSTVTANIRSEVDNHWQINCQRRDAEKLVTTLCRKFHLFATQLIDRYSKRSTIQISDEYDVQDLMHALLKLHFDDVRAEEVTPSVGGKSGRMDFLLKREQLVLETKMTRKGLDQKKVSDELIIDMKRYRAHPDYRTLICFVYDPQFICDNPTALEDDLTGNDGNFRTVVVVCPKGL